MPVDKAVPARRRERLRETLWPGSGSLIWQRSTNLGFTTVPRLLPLVLHLIRRLTEKGDPTSVYLDLWCRSHDEGIVSIVDEEQCAYAAGYTGTRALRTWREHVGKLADLGFIRVKREGNREIGHVLLVNPLAVCSRLHAEGRVPEEWWVAFASRASEIGATIPSPLSTSDNVQAESTGNQSP